MASFLWLFVVVRFSGLIPADILQENKEYIAWLYSSVGLIFGVISAFVIQNQWSKWDRLVNSVRGEIDGLKELLQLSKRFPEKNNERIKSAIETYLNCLIHKENWKQIEAGEKSEDVELAIETLQHELVLATEEIPKLNDLTFRTYTVVLEHKNKRLHYSSNQLPPILNLTIFFSTFLFIFLSMLMYVPNVYLDFIFKLGIALLSYLVFMVITDLDHPYRPGDWHLTKSSYKKLLDEIK